MNFYDEAAFYTSLGWKVFPISPGSKSPLKDTKGVMDATDDADVIGEWSKRWPDANIAIACGASDLMVVDLDPRHGCWDMLKKLESERKVFPLTVHAETRSKGLHLYFSMPKPLPDGWRRKLPGGIDIQVGNKYVLAPPSVIDPSKVDDGQGGAYRWLRAPLGGSLPVAPQWFFEMLRPPPVPKFQNNGQVAADVMRRLEGCAKKIEETSSGRNNELNKQAHFCGRMIVEKGLNAEAAEARLFEAAMKSGLTRRESLLTIRSGIRSGMRHAGGGNRA